MFKSKNKISNKWLINASNLHVGGGVQVATSFIYELSLINEINNRITIFSSLEVHNSLSELLKDNLSYFDYRLLDNSNKSFISRYFFSDFQNFRTVFTVFGPLYVWRKKFTSIVGFAQPWIIYPQNECYDMLSWGLQLKTRLKYWIQGLFFKRADLLVVELEHVKQRLISVLGIPAERIHVIPNCISSIFLEQEMWQPVAMPAFDGYLRLGFLGRNYLHKNTAIFPAIVAELKEKFKINARFYVTFTESEWKACTPAFRDVSINVGMLSAAQCPRFYQGLDGVVFPSLLECFSATPLEAMVMEKPLFVSDKPFNRDICGDHAIYFPPLSPKKAAEMIANVFAGKGPDSRALGAARHYAVNFSCPKERADRYIALLLGN